MIIKNRASGEISIFIKSMGKVYTIRDGLYIHINKEKEKRSLVKKIKSLVE